jgi:N-acetylglucosaminylphosphatidylinositol deacetylase
VVTFDGYGVSGHVNHIATYHGMERALAILRSACVSGGAIFPEGRSQHATPCGHRKNDGGVLGLKLMSKSLCRKFLGPFDIFFSLYYSNLVVMNFDLAVIYRGMRAHSSQNVWYRKIFILLSCFSYINCFEIMEEL